MGFNQFRYQVILRVLLLAITILVGAGLYYQQAFLLTTLLVFAVAAMQVYMLVKMFDKTNQEINTFLQSIKYGEFNTRYTTNTAKDSYQANLYHEFNEVLAFLRNQRQEQDAHYQYLKTIVQHVGIGLVTFRANGQVQIINNAAKRLLRVSSLQHLNELRPLSEELVECFFRLKTGGRDLVKIDRYGEEQPLSVFAIELTLKDEPLKLVSLQNIQSELEEKEMEAWQNLIRVLTHEIMNSVTPLSSLAHTLDGELEHYMGEPLADDGNYAIPQEDLEDIHQAIRTIHTRSEGLIRFVTDFRHLTKIPKAEMGRVTVADMFEYIGKIMEIDLREQGIGFTSNLSPKYLEIHADRELIIQVLINLVKNAAQAFEEEQKHRHISLEGGFDDKQHVVIKVKDNGPGIDEEAMHKIFIPFFTTKKNGSGIGLSLSRQIMRLHKGALTVKSEVDVGTEFTLRF